MWCGILVGVAGIFALGQSGAANPGFGPALLLPAYAAAFLGVTTYRSGFYNVVGSVVAILLLAVGFNGLSLLGVPFLGPASIQRRRPDHCTYARARRGATCQDARVMASRRKSGQRAATGGAS